MRQGRILKVTCPNAIAMTISSGLWSDPDCVDPIFITDQDIVIFIDDIRYANVNGQHQISASLFGHMTSSVTAYGDESAAHLHSALVTLMSDADDRLTPLEAKQLFQFQLDELNSMKKTQLTSTPFLEWLTPTVPVVGWTLDHL